jgi:N-acetylmuramoyl-L-alanine amidase
MLDVLRRQSGSGPGVASVRENESVRNTGSLQTLRIVVGQFGGLSSIARSVARALRQHGATVMSTDEYDAGAQAAAANRFGATLYIGFEARADVCTEILYFAVPSFESVGGRSLATHLVQQLDQAVPATPIVRGMRLAVLRETRMPAVLCSIGPVRDVVDATAAITTAVVEAARRWGEAPLAVPEAPDHAGDRSAER